MGKPLRYIFWFSAYTAVGTLAALGDKKITTAEALQTGAMIATFATAAIGILDAWNAKKQFRENCAKSEAEFQIGRIKQKSLGQKREL